jgi:hypothetical protein
MAALKGLMVWCGEPKKRACPLRVKLAVGVKEGTDTNNVESQDFEDVQQRSD